MGEAPSDGIKFEAKHGEKDEDEGGDEKGGGETGLPFRPRQRRRVNDDNLLKKG